MSVQNGCVAVPEPEAVSEQAGFVLSTMYVVDADAATPVRTMPAMTTPSTEPAMVTRRAAALIAALHRVTKPTGR
jgi:aminoglycoside phosphotransferase (APT) family kinase protein